MAKKTEKGADHDRVCLPGGELDSVRNAPLTVVIATKRKRPKKPDTAALVSAITDLEASADREENWLADVRRRQLSIGSDLVRDTEKSIERARRVAAWLREIA
jgi:hypothetical protein